jgi:hypothetical protein
MYYLKVTSGVKKINRMKKTMAKSQAQRSHEHRQGLARQLPDIRAELAELQRDLGDRLDFLFVERQQQQREQPPQQRGRRAA